MVRRMIHVCPGIADIVLRVHKRAACDMRKLYVERYCIFTPYAPGLETRNGMQISSFGTRRPSRAERWAPSIYFVVGQLGWFACVLSAAHDVPWMGVATAVMLVAIHLARVERLLTEFKLLVSVVAMGAIWESLPVLSGLLAYPNGMILPGAAPYWILALWALFAAQFNTTFGWLKQRVLLASVLGAIAGPMSFRAGAALGAVRFVHPLPAMILLAIGWAILMPLLIVFSRRWDGVH